MSVSRVKISSSSPHHVLHWYIRIAFRHIYIIYLNITHKYIIILFFITSIFLVDLKYRVLACITDCTGIYVQLRDIFTAQSFRSLFD